MPVAIGVLAADKLRDANASKLMAIATQTAGVIAGAGVGTGEPGGGTVQLRLSWNEIMGSKVSDGVYVKNLFNALYYQSGYVEGASGGFNTVIVGAPRTVAGEVSFVFQSCDRQRALLPVRLRYIRPA